LLLLLLQDAAEAEKAAKSKAAGATWKRAKNARLPSKVKSKNRPFETGEASGVPLERIYSGRTAGRKNKNNRNTVKRGGI
jgi:hypothetical protein